jgi:MFS family permease
VASGLAVGALTDRYGSRRVLALYLAPLTLALVGFSLTDSLVLAALCMALTGATAGAATVLFGTLWAEIYGPAHLGAIRALATALMVLATALGPGTMGALIDLQVGLDRQFLGLAVYCLACILLFTRLQPFLVSRPPAGPGKDMHRS